MTQPDPLESPEELIAAAADGTLTEPQARMLNALLLNNPAVRSAYVRRLHLEAGLHHLLAESVPGPGDTQTLLAAVVEVMEKQNTSGVAAGAAAERGMGRGPAVHRRAGRWGIRRAMWAAAAACVAVTLLAGLAIGLRSHPVAHPEVATEATLTAALDAQWGDSGGPDADHHLPGGPLVLQRGLVRLNATHGVTVVVQAPAAFQIESPTRLTLTRGSLTVHVPPEGVGFSVVTAQARVQDLGTEFGVYVDLDARTHAEVFVGKVSMTPTAGGDERIVPAGKAAQVADGATKVSETDNRPLAFVRPAQFDKLAGAADVRVARWQLFSESLRKDRGTIAYYPFDDESVRAGKALNRAERVSGVTDGELDNATWGEGRLPGKHAVVLNGSSRVHIDVPVVTKALTLAEWVNAGSFHEPPSPRDHQFAALMLSDGSRAAAVHWQVMDARRLELGLGLADLVPVPFERYRSQPVLSSADLDRWTFVAVVFDPSALQVRHYLNGERVSISPIGDHPDPLIGKAQIGNWAQVGPHNRGLLGRVDELAILDRAMTSQEIEAMYWAGGGNGD